MNAPPSPYSVRRDGRVRSETNALLTEGFLFYNFEANFNAYGDIVMEKKPQALVLDGRDNVATLLSDAKASDTVLLKGREGTVTAEEDIPFGHKISLRAIRIGEDIMKYGHKIGVATTAIEPGEWVHLHNMTSAVDLTFKKRMES